MKQRRHTVPGGLNLAQIRAIGRMTINFNWMEHGIEVLITTIISDSGGEKLGLIEHTFKPLGFRQKLQILRGLVTDLHARYVSSPELNTAYAAFAAEMKSLTADAERLNEFRNNVVHWRPFLAIHEWEKSPKFTAATAVEIDQKAIEMNILGIEFFARAIYLHKGDGSITFGTHVKQAASSP